MNRVAMVTITVSCLAGLIAMISSHALQLTPRVRLGLSDAELRKGQIVKDTAVPKGNESRRASKLAPEILRKVTQEFNEEHEREVMQQVDTDLSIDLQVQGFIERLTSHLGKDLRDAKNRLIRAPAAEMFLRLDAVQDQLAEMSPDERFMSLDKIREGFGYSLEDRQSQLSMDRYKEAKWKNGEQYMQARDVLLADELAERELTAALSQLREKFFGEEAPTIAVEENEGFFRFMRPRVYGKN